MANLKFYIKINDGSEIEVFPTKYEPFVKELEENEMFYRYKWGNIEFRNNPFQYNKTSNQAYLIYNILNALQRYDEIFIRFKDFDNDIEIKGYCGVVDGQFKNDEIHKVITITPTIIDRYTNLIENYKEKVDVLNGGDKNKIINGDFETWEGDIPFGWNVGADPDMERYYINGDYCARIADTVGTGQYNILSQSLFVNKGSNIDLSFYYATLVIGVTKSYGISRRIAIKLTGSGGTKYLKDQDISNNENVAVWVDPSSDNTFNYGNNLVQMQAGEITSFKYYRIFSEPIPFEGALTITFFANNGVEIILGLPHATFLLLDDVSLKVNTTPYKTINIDFLDYYLQSYPAFTESVPLAIGVPNKKWSSSWVGDHALDGYFNLTTGAPSTRFLTDATYAPVDSKNLRLGDYMNFFDNDPANKYYKCQISEATIYHCGTYNKGLSYNHRMRATAVFSRDEVKIKDVLYTYQDYLDGKCDESEVGTIIPPARNVGWTKTPILDKGLRLWVRKPFNDESDTLGWSLGAQINGGKFQSYNTEHRRTTKRIYPVDTSKSKTLNTCVDLRDTIKILFNQTHPDYSDKDVVSTFFWNDFEFEFQSLQGEQSGFNYVNNKPNFLNGIAVLHTLDLKTENVETIQQEGTLKISLFDFLEDLKSYFKVYKYGQLFWWITDNLDLRIEHTAYFDNYADIYGNVLNYTTQPMIQEDYHDDYSYEPELMYKKITFDQVNAAYPDFTANTIKFDRISSSKRYKNDENILKNKTSILTTDLKYCIEKANDLNDGLILVNYTQINDQFVVLYGDTQIQGTKILNGNLSLSSILNNFVRREGTYTNGQINDQDVRFYNTTYSKKGVEFTVKGIIDNRFFDTNIDRSGMVKTLTHDFENQITKITLMYRIKSGLIVQDEIEGLMFLNLGF